VHIYVDSPRRHTQMRRDVQLTQMRSDVHSSCIYVSIARVASLLLAAYIKIEMARQQLLCSWQLLAEVAERERERERGRERQRQQLAEAARTSLAHTGEEGQCPRKPERMFRSGHSRPLPSSTPSRKVSRKVSRNVSAKVSRSQWLNQW
jgi:hypothetical protein